ncbi:MAG TPA: Rid family hydrolase [Acidimicrobiia bacterium]|jgi:enamine deaminase RidA (YjgF/YER057c/UK114 family)
MSSELVNPAGLPPAVGFSHLAVTTQGLIFLAGQTGHHQDGSIAPGLVEQFAQACRNVQTCLLSVGAGGEDLVSLQIFVTDLAAYRSALPELGASYREVFGKRYPPVALIGVVGLFDPAAQVELVGVAAAPA